MKNIAVMDGNIVINIVVCNDDYVPDINEIEYSPAQPAWVGGDYVNGKFYSPQPFPSWTRGEDGWVPPIPMPENNLEINPTNKMLYWDEETLDWIWSDNCCGQ